MKDLVGQPEASAVVEKRLSFKSPIDNSQSKLAQTVEEYVLERVVPLQQRLTEQALADQDELDADFVQKSLETGERTYPDRLTPIVKQLHKFTDMQFSSIYFERNSQGALAKLEANETVLYIDFATMKKPQSHLALIIAHEWGHLVKGHLYGPRGETYEKEHEADFEAGKFLGAYDYDIDAIVRMILKMPEHENQAHGTNFGRACNIKQGYLKGVEMRRLADEAVNKNKPN